MKFVQLLLFILYNFPIIFLAQSSFGVHAAKVLPQNPKFSHLPPSDGLSSSSINVMLQDHQGYMWLGTNDGLNRYDGRSFTIYRKSSGLLSNSILDLYQSDGDTLWVSTEKGLNFIVPKQKLAESPEFSPPVSSFEYMGRIWSIVQIYHQIYLAAEKGFFELYLHEGNWRLKKLLSLSCYDIERIGQELFIATEAGVYLYDNKQISLLPALSFESYELCSDQKTLFGSTKDGRIFKYNFKLDKLDFFDKRQAEWKIDWISEMLLDQQERLWVNPYGDGIHVLDAETLALIHSYHFESGNPFSLSTNLVESIYIDEAGILWAGTANAGCDLFNIHSPKQAFHLLQNEPNNGFDLEVDGIHGIYVDTTNKIWLGTDGGGLYVLLPDSTSAHNYRIEHHYKEGITTATPALYPYIILPETENIFWIPDWVGLFRVDQATGHCYTFFSKSKLENRKSVMNITSDQKGIYWLSTWDNGVASFDPKSYPNITFKWYDKTIPNGISENRVEALLVGKSNALWIGTVGGGLSKLDTSRTSYTHSRYIENDSTSISSDLIYSLYQNDDSTLWVGTQGGGLNKLNLNTNQFKSYTTEDGLPNNVIYSILPDDEGNIWLSTNLGLSQFKPAEETFKNFDVQDGLQSNEFNRHAAFRANNGYLYFGGIKGMTYFHPNDIQTYSYLPPLAFSKLLVNQKEIAIQQNLVLKHNENLIEIEFAALSFEQPFDNQYRYRLIGVSDDWIEAGNKNTVIYSHLKAGKYNFEVQGSNSDGIWNRDSLQLKFRISPPWWQSIWAYIFYTTLFFIIIYAIYRFKLNKKLAEAEAYRLKELDQLKTDLYTNITHEFRTPLTVILGISTQLKKEVNENAKHSLEIIQRNGQQLLNLVNQMLDLSKLESGKIELKYTNGDIINFLKYLYEAFHSVAEASSIQLHFLSDLDELKMDYDIERVQQIFYNIVSNSFKFTPEGGNIYVQAYQNGQYFQLKIKDTGIGIPNDQLDKIFDRFYQTDFNNQSNGTGIGLALVKELVKLMDGTIEVVSKVGKGTEFILQLPIKSDAATITAKPNKPFVVFNSDISVLPNTFHIPTKVSVLVIEDNEDVLYYITSCLKDQFNILSAQNGEEGIQLAQKNIPNLIISDIMMPLKDGFEVCKILKTDRRTSHIPIILLTAKADQPSKLKGLKQGADIYLEKPFQAEELLIQMHNLLQHQERLKQHYLLIFNDTITTTENTTPESDFLAQVKKIIKANLTNTALTVVQLSKEVALSQSQLHRKLKALTGYSAIEMIRMIRLQHAKQLLQQTSQTITSIAYESGFNDPDYFSKVFRKAFGQSPSEFRI